MADPAPAHVAVVVVDGRAYVLGPGVDEALDGPGLVEWLGTRAAAVRLVVWSAANALPAAVGSGLPVTRTWDLAEGHRLLHGGWDAGPGHVVAGCAGLPDKEVPQSASRLRPGFDLDLLDVARAGDDALRTPEGHLRPDALGHWASTDERRRELAELALWCRSRQEEQLRAGATPDEAARRLHTVWSESAAAVLCLELSRDGLPVDRPAAEDLIAAAAGPRPRDEEEAARTRRERDRAVLRHAPGHERLDLRNPASVKVLLAAVGVDVPNTRAWALEPYRHTHPLVDALLSWRKDERIATTYGYRWLDEHVGDDDRLRGAWTACDGAAGRMTAQNGLHNLPATLRPAVRAARGHVFVRADLGQIEPRVLAVVSGDPAFAAATRADDLYAPVAQALGADRATAKVAVLAAMYGQRSGAAGVALSRLERAYPVAMGLLDRAYADGVARRPLRTFGGRLIPLGEGADDDGAPATARDAARGRYARNAIIQGSAAELFKAWAVTVRHAVRPLDGRIVLCLHDELLVHVPEGAATEARDRVTGSLTAAARRWAGTDAVRFVADTSVVHRWSEAKG